MPELPEVEALRLSLLPLVVDQKILQTEVLHPKLVSSAGTKRLALPAKAEEFMVKTQGKTIIDISRRAKNLLLALSDGVYILVHLKMTGQLVYQTTVSGSTVWGGHPIQLTHQKLPNKHTYVIFRLQNGTLFYNDVRQFGYLLVFDSLEAVYQSGHLDNLGLEPLSSEFTLDKFIQAMRQRRGNLKKLFLDQRVVVGLGNIYADEVCFRAGVRPTRTVESLKLKELKSLYTAITQILPEAVQDGGSSVANYLLADGQRGNFARKHFVYNRGGEDCKICASTLKKIKLAGRTTVYCPKCQK